MRHEKLLAFSIIAILLAPLALTFIPEVAEASEARSGTPDLEVVSVTISSGGSIDTGSGIVLAPGQHVVSVLVKNVGTAASAGIVVLNNGSVANPSNLVDSAILQTIQPGGQASAVLFNWSAIEGASQRLRATVNTAEDPNSLNNQANLDFSVSSLQSGEVSSHDTPEPAIGETDVRFSDNNLGITASVRNIGVMPLQATLRLTLNNLSTSTSLAFHSSPVVLSPGTLTSISQSSGVSVDADVSGIDGSWSMAVDVLFNGSSGDDVSSIVAAQNVTFSPYNALLSAPADRSTQPGDTTQLTFVVRNIGNAADSFDISLSSSIGWADISQDGETTTVVNSNGMLSVVIPVSVPENAARSELEQVDLTLTSTSASYDLSASAKVMAGDLFRAELESPHMGAEGVVWLDGSGGIGGVIITSSGSNYLDSSGAEETPILVFSGGDGSGAVATAVMDGSGAVSSVTIDNAGTGYTVAPDVAFSPGADTVHFTPIIPGSSVSVPFTITNSGNVPSSYVMDTGFSSTANGWQATVLTPTTDIIPVGESRTVSVLVSSPSLQNPMDPSNRLRDGETLGLWLEAAPSNGGISTSVDEQISVQPTIIVDPGLETTQIDLTEEQILGALGSTGVELFVDMEVEVVHNLVNGPEDAVGVALEVGNVSFTPSTSGGLFEVNRWSASTSITSTSLALGQTEMASLGILGPSDMLPLAGTLTVPVIASPTISVAQSNANVNAAPVERIVTITIPELVSVELEHQEDLKVIPGNESIFDFNLTNTGNDLTSYLISLGSGHPSDWDVGVGSGASSMQIKDVEPEMYNHPQFSGNDVVSFSVNITVPSYSPAGVTNVITLMVADLSTGELLFTKDVEFDTQEKVSADITVDEIHLEVGLTDTPPYARVFIENTGNVLTTYSLWLDTSQSNDVAFFIDGDEEITIGAGYTASVKVRISPASDASSDYNHSARLHVSAPEGVNESVLIDVSINASKGISIGIPNVPDVIPGENLTLVIDLNNTGNLLQNFTFSSSNDAGWQVVLGQESFSLAQGEATSVVLIVVVPPLDSTTGMSDGSSYTLSFSAQDDLSSEIVGSASTELTVAPVFKMNHSGWDEIAHFYRDSEWEYNAEVTNTGNRNVTVEIIYSIVRPGGAGIQQAWEVSNFAPALLNMPVGEPVPLSFRVTAVEYEPDILLAGDLIVEIRPVDADVSGSSVLISRLEMSRMFSDGEPIIFQPVAQGMGTVTEYLKWSHIPLANSGMVIYEIELCGTERLIPTSDLVDPGFDEWSFSLQVGAYNYPFNMNLECGDSGGGSQIALPGALAWEEQWLQLIIGTPVHPYLVADDGWNLTFRLYNSEEHQNYTQYTEATFGFKIKNTANPKLSNLRLSSGETVVEDEEVTVLVDLSNTGTASAAMVAVELTCESGMSVVGDAVQEVLLLPPQEEQTLEWSVNPTRLDWWEHDASIDCSATVSAQLASGNELADDKSVMNSQVTSWAPHPALTVIGFALLLILTGIMVRIGSQSEKFLQGAAFTGALASGLAFHMGALFESTFSIWFSFIWLVIGALWVLWIAWRSGEEFQLVHEDYQRAKQGQSTIYTDHYSALRNARRQLVRILSVPVLGSMVVILGLPPRLNPDPMNIAMLFAYLVIVIGGVWFIIRTAESTYGNIYQKIIDINHRSDRLQVELGDPARLLTELARSGLDMSAILNQDSEGGDD